MDPATLTVLFVVGTMVVVALCCCLCNCNWCNDADRPDQPPAETPEQRFARTLAVWEALAARAEAALAAQEAAAAPPPVPLPYFPYAAKGGGVASEVAECSICLEPLRQWQLCSEVPACRHVFHRECLGAWARSSGSCPLCRAKIVRGSSDEVAIADDIV